MKTALVTGGTGFVGSHIVRRLVRDGWTVHLLCRETSNHWRLADLPTVVHRHLGALQDLEGLKRIVAAVQPDCIFHLASATVVAGAGPQASELLAVNLLGTVNLIEACDSINYSAMVITGDSFEYACSTEKLREADACRPDTMHGISKLGAMLAGQAVARNQNRPIVGLRLFSTYGPNDNPRRLVPRMITNARAGADLPLSRPEIARDWVYIDDVVELYLEASQHAARLAGQVFNVGSGEATSIGSIVDTILRLSGSCSEVGWGKFVAPRHDDFPWIADMTHTFAHFDWRPRTSLEGGLKMTIDAADRAAAVAALP